MSLSQHLITEKENFFQLSYSLSGEKFPYLSDKIQQHLPSIKVVERGNTSYGYFEGSDEALFKYDWDRAVMSSDYTYNELLQLRPNDLDNEETA